MEEEEPDYLSEQFVVNPECDVRPGLLYHRGQKRQHEIAKRQVEANKKSKTKPLRVLEEEKRTHALDSALTPSNKGFALLQKMGYKPGMAIGKQGASAGSNVQEPIRPVVKNNRFGLGQEAEQKERAEQRVRYLQDRHMQQVRDAQNLSVNFQSRVRCKRKAKQVLVDFSRSQKVCLHLDSQAGFKSPIEDWFWPPNALENQDEDDTDEEEDDEEDFLDQKCEQLKVVTCHLRDIYFYCLWCGTSYNDVEDLEANCPGPTSEDHD